MKVAIFQLGLFGINTYVVYDSDTRDAAIIDPGMSTPDEEKALSDFIRRENLHVTHIINTHLHIDHAIGNKFAVEQYHVPVMAHKADLPLGERMQQQAEMFGIPRKLEGVTISDFINDGDVIRIGNGSLTAIHIPGHSPGSIVLYDAADNFVIAGDVLFEGSVGRSDLPGGDGAALIRGIKEKLLPLPDNTVVYPGHGPATTIGNERRYNPFLR